MKITHLLSLLLLTATPIARAMDKYECVIREEGSGSRGTYICYRTNTHKAEYFSNQNTYCVAKRIGTIFIPMQIDEKTEYNRLETIWKKQNSAKTEQKQD